MYNSSILMQLGQGAVQHQDELEEVKRRVGVTTNYFDCWIYGFLENKKFDIEETVAKLIRRDAMEKNELGTYEITDYMRETMSKGIIQLIGDDKEGRVTFYIVTNRDHPTAKRREENKRNFDMWVSYGSRLRKENQKCRITMLINQTDAGMWANTDMAFQADVALRIAKYYPGVVDRMYICKMNRTLSTLAKPIFSRLPKVVSERIHIVTESDIEKGRLLELFDEDVLPVALGGKNACDGPTNWNRFTDIISRHFTQVRGAIQAGKGVKEWELEQLMKEVQCEDSVSQAGSEHNSPGTVVVHQPATPQPSFRGAVRRLTDQSDDLEDVISDDRTLLTCNTEDGNSPGLEMEPFQIRIGVDALTNQRSIEEWGRHVTSGRVDAESADALNLLELHEETFRRNLTELQAMNLLTIVDRFGPLADASADVEANHMLFGTTSHNAIVKNFPLPLRSVIRGTLWVVCVIMAFYFLIATVFGAAVGCSMMAVFYFGMVAQPYYLYPFGFALLVCGYQTATLCARGYELVRTSFRGRMFHFLQPLGPRRALQVQAVLFVVITLALFVVFCKYSADYDPLTGIQYSVASGWVICSVIVLLYHVMFIVGVRGDGTESYTSHRKSNPNISGVSLYLFLDVTEKYDDLNDKASKQHTSYLMLACIPAAVAMLSGIAFMVSVHQVFIVACLVATTSSGFLANFLTEGDSWDHSATLVRVVTCFCCVTWLYITLSIGFFGASDGWAGALILLLVTMAVWAMLAVGSARYSEGAKLRQWLFRIGGMIFIGHIITAIVMLFIDGWRVGVLILCLLTHSAVSFFRHGATSMVGTLTCAVGFLALVIATFIIGMDPEAIRMTSTPLSIDMLRNFSYNSSVRDATYGTPDYTACLSRFPQKLDLVAMALFAAITYAQDPTVLRSDLQHFFGSSTYEVPSSVLSEYYSVPAAERFSDLYAFRNPAEQNVTVLVFSNSRTAPYALMESMTMWVETMAIAPIALILPEEWAVMTIYRVSRVVSDLSPLKWHRTLSAATTAVRQFVANEQATTGNDVYIVGHDLSGGLAAIVGSRLGIRTVTFGAPGMVFSRAKFGVQPTSLERFVIPVGAKSSTLALIGGLEKKTVELECSSKTEYCRRASYFVSSLESVCNPPL